MIGNGPAALPAVLRYGDRRLRVRCDEVDPGQAAVRELADLMWTVLRSDTGVALAAPQIGSTRRVIVVDDPRTRAHRPLVLVNPLIDDLSGPEKPFEEGCLSFPGLYIHVRRPRDIRVSYHDADGRPRQLATGGLLARIVKHEIDHLDGILFVDHLPAWRRWLLAGRLWLMKSSRGR